MGIVIVGLGSAGFAAYLAIRKTDRNAQITIVDAKSYELMHICGLPFALNGEMLTEKLRHPGGFDAAQKYLGHRAVLFEPDKKELVIEKIGTDERTRIAYDALILTPGARPFVPPIEGVEQYKNKGVFTLYSPEDVERIQKSNAQQYAIVGAGAIGLEAAVSLRKTGAHVHVIELQSGPFPGIIDPDMASLITHYCESQGIQCSYNNSVNKIVGDSVGVKGVVLDEQTLACDAVLLACGVRANSEMLKECGTTFGKHGVKVNAHMQTNFEHVYAAGDIVETNFILDNSHCPSQLATLAYDQGTVAGINAAGGSAHYDGTLLTFVSCVGDLEVAACGFDTARANAAGYSVTFGKVKTTAVPEWALAREKCSQDEITVKILVDKTTHEIIGCQAIGAGAAAKVNVLSTAIRAKMKIQDLARVEFAYCPHTANIPDAVTLACENAMRKLR